MLPGWVAVTVCIAYAGLVLAIAWFGDRTDSHAENPALRKAVYALTACVYCSSWTFYDSVGVATRRGIDYLPFYLGPIIVFAFSYPLLMRIVRVAKAQHITSVADFVAVRYGKSAAVAATVTVLAAIAYLPLIAVQLKAVVQSLSIFLDGQLPTKATTMNGSVAAIIAIALAGLTIAVGTRRLDATEHHRGLMLAIAAGAVLELIAFLTVGAFICWGVFHGIGDLTERVTSMSSISTALNAPAHPSLWAAMTVVTMAAVLVLPRQFHVSVVENRNEADVRTAAWIVPLYLVLMALFVMPMAAASLLTFPDGKIDRAFTILALPISVQADAMTLLAFVGGLAAATGTFFIATIALAVMISNDLVIPLLIRFKRSEFGRAPETPPVLFIRRVAIVSIVAAAWLAAVLLSGSALSSLGFLSVVCGIQIAPAALGGLFWSRGTARGAIWGPIAGVVVWAYTLVLPTISARSSALIIDGPLGFDVLRPTALFGVDLAPFQQGLVWSLAVNIAIYVTLSLSRPATANERLQANIFVNRKTMSFATSFRLLPFTVSVGELLTTVARYLGTETTERLFRDHYAVRDLPFDTSSEADASLLIYSEQLIASVMGAASARTIVSLLLDRREMSQNAALQIVDDVAFEIQNSRDVLQHAIDITRDGMAVYDRDLRLVAWNRAYRDMFQLPPELLREGVALDVLVRSNAERGVYGPGPIDEFVASRLETLTRPTDGLRLHGAPFGRILEMRSVRLHNGGMFFTYTDATAQVQSEIELEAENVTLERRVRERTEELQTLNFELARAKAEAENANISKTRFLAAASHDLLQPLNAARLYTTSLRERLRLTSTEETSALAANVDASLESVEEILGALLEISHLDAGATKTEIVAFSLSGLMRQLQIEFEPLARGRGLRLVVIPSNVGVVSDRKLLRRLLQNLMSNAIKYTPDGRVIVGVRRSGSNVRIDVIDTGLGIPASKQKTIFREFERLEPAARSAPGAGLGLSIVERLSRILEHEVRLRSKPNEGSVFSVTLPRAATPAITGTTSVGMGPARQRSLEGLVVAAIDNERPILDGMEALLLGWDCVVIKGTDLFEIERALGAHTVTPNVIVADYHIGEIDGLGVISALRQRYGHLPAVLITADRHSAVRDLAANVDVRVLNKPVKPAALRSLLSQWRLVKAAAE